MLFRHFGKTIEEGAQTQIHLAVSEELEGVSGFYFSDYRQELEPSKHAQDDVAAKKLWEVSAKLVGLEVTSSLNIETTMKIAKENQVTRMKSKPSCFNTGPDKFESFNCLCVRTHEKGLLKERSIGQKAFPASSATL